MKRVAFALSLALSIAACSQAAPPQVKEAWTRDTVGGTANAAVFMRITSQTADRLVSASTPAARKTDLMTMASMGSGAGGVMEMRYLKGIDIPANTPVTLNAGGLHVWLADLTQPLRAGQSFPLTLRFEKAGERHVTVSVIAPSAPPPMPGM